MRKKLTAVLAVLLCMAMPVMAYASETTDLIDFDPDTNVICYVSELSYEVPKDWTASENEDGDTVYYCCSGGMLMVQCMDLDGDVLLEENTDFLLEGMRSGMEDIADETIGTARLNGCDKEALYYANFCTIDGKDMKFYSTIGSFEDDAKAVSFSFCSYADAEQDHAGDYFAVMDSVKYADNDDMDYEGMYWELLEEYTRLKTDYDMLLLSMDAEGEAAAETEAEESVDEAEMTMGQKNALSSAQNYLNLMAFSREGLIGQLEYEGYSTEDAEFAADGCDADWNEQAVKAAEKYLNFMAFSREGLIRQLEHDGFTAEQAEYAADAAGY